DNILGFAGAYGLAIQGLKLARLQTNLLPKEIRMERLIRSKKPWAVAAAAMLLLGTAALTFGYKIERDAVASPDISSAINQVGKPAIDQLNAVTVKVQNRKNDYNRQEKSVRAVIAGQEERLNWIALNKFINDCLPRPDGTNLDGGKDSGPQRTAYWQKEHGDD